MPSFSQAKAGNLKSKLFNKTALVVGGTSGIGEAVAIKLAEMQASVFIAGRNASAASAILQKCRSLNPEGNHSFIPIDLSLMKDVKRFSAEFMASHKSLDYFVVSAGIMTMAGRNETEEGIDKKMAVHYYGRWKLIQEMMPLFKSSNTRVLSILAANQGGQININDLDLKNTFSVKNAAMAAPTYNDLMVQQLGRLHPSMSFAHMYPGIVKTPLMDNLPFYLRWPAKLITPFMTSSSDCSEIVGHVLTSSEFEKGGWIISEKGDAYTLNPKIHTEENAKIVWDHTEKLVGA